MVTTTEVVVVGAGYAGVAAANKLARSRRGLRVVMVNPAASFVERIRLHEFAATGRRVSVLLQKVLHPAVDLRIARGRRLGDGQLETSTGGMAFDYCVLAVGATPRATPQHAYAVGEFDAAARLHRRLAALRPGAPVVVVGGGFTGVETATEIASARPDLVVRIVAPDLTPDLPAATRRRLRAALETRTVTTCFGTVDDVTPDEVLLADGSALASACTVWATGDRAPDLARVSGLPVDEWGRVLTDEFLTSIADPRVVATGDAAAPPARVAGGLRPSCQAAIPLGFRAADAVLADLDGRPRTPANVRFVGRALSVGRDNGVVQPTNAHDVPIGPAVLGAPGAVMKELACRYTVTRLRLSRGRPAVQQRVAEPAHAR